MQVTHVQDKVTHAVIGGGDTIDFGISSSAEFFNILSSTLYSDQILAVVREVLCNAWDAHIEAGCTDKPVQITLDNNKFSIKDFGKGIHHDDIGPIYGTYGNSTKKNDGNQTGGFGLGCKAPFAYTEHFEVISCHQGVKTIYTMAKSSAQVTGKPGITTIAQFPTTETGLTVTIQVASSDLGTFRKRIQEIVFRGDMNMTLNGLVLPKLNFDASITNYLIVRKNENFSSTEFINVRYGNVIYPVTKTEAIASTYKSITNYLGMLGDTCHCTPYLIFQAPPHSIAVTPSRETLSMQDHTVKTLKELFANYLKEFQKHIPVEKRLDAKRLVEAAVEEKAYDKLFPMNEGLPFKPGTRAQLINTWQEQAHQMLLHQYPREASFFKEDKLNRINALVAADVVDKKLATSLLKHLASKSTDNWVTRKYLAPIIKKMLKQGLQTSRLFVWSKSNKRYSSDPVLNAVTTAFPHTAYHELNYLRNIVVVTTSQTRAVRVLENKEDPLLKSFGNSCGLLVYNAPLSKGAAQEALNFFTNLGMRVIDLTVKERSAVEKPKTTTPKKPRRKGYPLLADIVVELGYVYYEKTKHEATRYTENPLCYVRVKATTHAQATLGKAGEITSSYNVKMLNTLFGGVCAVVSTQAKEDALIKQGVPNIIQYAAQEAQQYVNNNPHIADFYKVEFDSITERIKTSKLSSYQYDRLHKVLPLILNTPELAKHFGFYVELTEKDKIIIKLIEFLYHQRAYMGEQSFVDFLNFLNKLKNSKPPAALGKLTSKVMAHKKLLFIDTDGLRAILTGIFIPGNKKREQTRKHALEFFLNTFNS